MTINTSPQILKYLSELQELSFIFMPLCRRCPLCLKLTSFVLYVVVVVAMVVVVVAMVEGGCGGDGGRRLWWWWTGDGYGGNMWKEVVVVMKEVVVVVCLNEIQREVDGVQRREME
uniref:Transmembrane protein n=1 Tax=Helianthus annuus TaxID=4232 RepID=A0A251VN90_HELAN